MKTFERTILQNQHAIMQALACASDNTRIKNALLDQMKATERALEDERTNRGERGRILAAAFGDGSPGPGGF